MENDANDMTEVIGQQLSTRDTPNCAATNHDVVKAANDYL